MQAVNSSKVSMHISSHCLGSALTSEFSPPNLEDTLIAAFPVAHLLEHHRALLPGHYLHSLPTAANLAGLLKA